MNDQKIIAAIARQDERMFALVIRKYTRLLWKVAASVLINAASVQDVEECVADVFIYLWQCPEKYDPDKAKLSSWLSMVARSKAVDRYRRTVRKREISLEKIVMEEILTGESAAESLECAGMESEADEEKDRLRSCVEELDEKEKELIVRRYYYEQKPAEIAFALDMSVKQVENRLYYVKQKLKKMMETQEGEQ